MCDSTIDLLNATSPTIGEVAKHFERENRRDLCTNACEGLTEEQLREVIAAGGFGIPAQAKLDLLQIAEAVERSATETGWILTCSLEELAARLAEIAASLRQVIDRDTRKVVKP